MATQGEVGGQSVARRKMPKQARLVVGNQFLSWTGITTSSCIYHSGWVLMAPTKQPVLGSAAIEMPVPQRVRVTESTCLQLSLFKGAIPSSDHALARHSYGFVCNADIMKEYRRLDDTITMRLNRNNAQWRDKDRLSGKLSSSQDDACEYFWKELVGTFASLLRYVKSLELRLTFCLGSHEIANWKGRAAVIDYCVRVADNVVEGKKKALKGQEPSLDAERKFRSSIFGDEVKVRSQYSP